MVVIEVIEGYHALEPPCFILLIIEVPPLTVCLDLVIDVLDLLQFRLGVEVFLLL